MRFLNPFLLVLVILLSPQSGLASEAEDILSTLTDQAFDVGDRLDILNLLQVYSHAADGLHTELFGQAFTEDAVFSVVAFGVDMATKPQALGRGREGIVKALAERHRAFSAAKIQRRHFLTNPIVWNQTESGAEVSVYLQLRSSQKGEPSKLIATGRYQGRVLKTSAGWRISEWTLFSDQALD